MTNRARFLHTYTALLTARMIANPANYGPAVNAEPTARKMVDAAARGDVSLKANPALRETCRVLRIPVNIPSLRQFLSCTGCPSDGLVDPGPPLLGSST